MLYTRYILFSVMRKEDIISSSGAPRLASPPSPGFAKPECDEGWALRTRKRECTEANCRIPPSTTYPCVEHIEGVCGVTSLTHTDPADP